MKTTMTEEQVERFRALRETRNPKPKPIIQLTWKERFPEKYSANNSLYEARSRGEFPYHKGYFAHHWCFEERYHLDVFLLDAQNMALAMSIIEYDQNLLMYVSLDGELLESKDMHYEYLVHNKVEFNKTILAIHSEV